MARAKIEQQRNLSPQAVIFAIEVINRALDAHCNTAPRAVEAMGGRDAIRKRLEGMAVGQGEVVIGILGPIARLTIEQWSAMAAEHAEHQKETEFKDTVAGGVSGKAEATDRRGVLPFFSKSVRGRGLVR